MNRRTQTILGFIALLLAGASGYAVYVFFDRLTTMATLPVPAQVIPAGALIAPEMLTEREVPRALLDEPVYQGIADLAGKVAQVPLQPGMVVYHSFAVSPAAYRLVDDPALVVAALPIDPARAVGGQIQPGHHIDLWQLPKLRQTAEAAQAITPTLVLSDVRVVDVRGSSGQAVARLPQAVPGEAAAQSTSQQQALPLQILTVALPVSQTETLMGLIAADQSNDAFLWVALSPLSRTEADKGLPSDLQLPLPAPTSAPTVAAKTDTSPEVTPTAASTPAPMPTMTPTATATLSLDIRSVQGTGGIPLVVRDAPNGAVIGELPEGSVVIVTEGSAPDAAGVSWAHCTQHGEQGISGWVAASFLEALP